MSDYKIVFYHFTCECGFDSDAYKAEWQGRYEMRKHYRNCGSCETLDLVEFTMDGDSVAHTTRNYGIGIAS